MPRMGICFAVLLCGLPLAAESWDAVRSLDPGSPVIVRNAAGEDRKGALRAVSADSISLQTDKGEVMVPRAGVRRVRVKQGLRRARNLLIGAAIGAVVGLIADNTAGSYVRNETGEGPGARAVTYLAPTAIFGAIGAALSPYHTVYRAR